MNYLDVLPPKLKTHVIKEAFDSVNQETEDEFIEFLKSMKGKSIGLVAYDLHQENCKLKSQLDKLQRSQHDFEVPIKATDQET